MRWLSASSSVERTDPAMIRTPCVTTIAARFALKCGVELRVDPVAKNFSASPTHYPARRSRSSRDLALLRVVRGSEMCREPVFQRRSLIRSRKRLQRTIFMRRQFRIRAGESNVDLECDANGRGKSMATSGSESMPARSWSPQALLQPMSLRSARNLRRI